MCFFGLSCHCILAGFMALCRTLLSQSVSGVSAEDKLWHPTTRLRQHPRRRLGFVN